MKLAYSFISLFQILLEAVIQDGGLLWNMPEKTQQLFIKFYWRIVMRFITNFEFVQAN